MSHQPQLPVQSTDSAVPVSDALTLKNPHEGLALLETQIMRSYAHNSLLYEAMEKAADLETITHFLRWDSQQPSFDVYLKQWVDKCPPCIRKELDEHIGIEVNECHSGLFKEMMTHLDTCVTSETSIDAGRATKLNYTFSAECAEERDIGFFLGGFWATEIMSGKRCGQLYRGLRRNGVPDTALTYMKIHFEVDANHGDEVRDHFIKPALQQYPELMSSIREGVHDRLNRSAEYLMWYEVTLLPNIHTIAA